MGFVFYDVTFGGKYTYYFKHVIAESKVKNSTSIILRGFNL